LKREGFPTVQVPILAVLVLIAGIAFLIRGAVELNRLLRWVDNRTTVQGCRAAILRAENSGQFEDARILRVVEARYVQRAERDRPATSGVLSLIGCAIGALVASVAAGRCLGAFWVAAIMRRSGGAAGNLESREQG
jgi:hypothetical protein